MRHYRVSKTANNRAERHAVVHMTDTSTVDLEFSLRSGQLSLLVSSLMCRALEGSEFVAHKLNVCMSMDITRS